jgi:hypothetical protein
LSHNAGATSGFCCSGGDEADHMPYLPELRYQRLRQKMGNEATMSGYASGLETTDPTPQIEWKLIVRVERVIQFTQTPHSDREE